MHYKRGAASGRAAPYPICPYENYPLTLPVKKGYLCVNF
jgi:hypothetical protein